MNLFSKCIKHFLTGMGIGAVLYLLISICFYPGEVLTTKGVISVLVIAGVIGIWSLIFKSDLPLIPTIIIHLIGTFLLICLMALINNWQISWGTILIFIITYFLIWLYEWISQHNALNKINVKIKQRNLDKK